MTTTLDTAHRALAAPPPPRRLQTSGHSSGDPWGQRAALPGYTPGAGPLPDCLPRSPGTSRPRPPPVGVRSSTQGTARLPLPPKLPDANFPGEAPEPVPRLTWGVGGSALGHRRPWVRIIRSSRHRPRQSPLGSILLQGPSSWLALTTHPHPAASAQPAVGSARPAVGAATGGCVPALTSLGAHPRRQAGYFSSDQKKKNSFLKKEQTSDELLPSVMFLVPGYPHTS